MRIFLDSNVILSTIPRVLFLQLAKEKRIELWFSKSVEEESMHVALRKSLEKDIASAFVELHLYANFLVTYQEDMALWLPDENDRHVVLSAKEAKCEIIATENLRDFPKAALEPLGMNAQSPDQILSMMALQDALDLSAYTPGELKRAKLYRTAKQIKEKFE